MYKIFLIILGSAVLLFTGCANKVHEYAVSSDNILQLQQLSKQGKKIALNKFTDSGREETKVMCRLATPIGTPQGQTFAEYIHKAFEKELIIANMYDPNEATKLSLNLDDIYGSTVLGNAYWKFDVTVKSSNGKSLKLTSRYDYESSYFASSACSEMQRSFVLAVQKLIHDIISHPKFRELLS